MKQIKKRYKPKKDNIKKLKVYLGEDEVNKELKQNIKTKKI